MRIPTQRLPSAEGLDLPRYASDGAAGADLHAALTEPVTLEPGERALIPTGIALALPDGFEGQVRPRSGLALRHGVTTLNTPGTIDPDYRGEIGVILANLGTEPVTIRRGDRIAQLVIARFERVEFVPADALPQTARGRAGFGSTGGGL